VIWAIVQMQAGVACSGAIASPMNKQDQDLQTSNLNEYIKITNTSF
jgi:hypothetical protein